MHIPEKELRELCGKHPILRLSLFGSILTDHFSDRSDVDVLTVFDEAQVSDWFDSFFSLHTDLEALFGRAVDLVIEKPFRNPVFKDTVEKTMRVVYER